MQKKFQPLNNIEAVHQLIKHSLSTDTGKSHCQSIDLQTKQTANSYFILIQTLIY